MSSFVPYTFGVCYATANRVFRTMLRIVAYIGGKHQPYPSPDVLLRESTRAAAAERGHCHFQRWRIFRPTQIHSVVFSQYKHDHTGKLNAMVTCDGYVVEITRAYSGRTTDNQLHTAEAIGKRLNEATATRRSLIRVSCHCLLSAPHCSMSPLYSVCTCSAL